MLSLPASIKVFLCLKPVDMRLSFDRLAALAEEASAQTPFSGHLFVFYSKRRDRIKILYWDRDGMALWYKRLEKGVFPIPKLQENCLTVTPAELSMLLEGVDLSAIRHIKKTPRFSLPEISQKIS